MKTCGRATRLPIRRVPFVRPPSYVACSISATSSCRSAVTVAAMSSSGKPCASIDREASLPAIRNFPPGGTSTRARKSARPRKPSPDRNSRSTSSTESPARTSKFRRAREKSSIEPVPRTSPKSPVSASSSNDMPRFVSTVTRAASAKTMGSALGSWTVPRRAMTRPSRRSCPPPRARPKNPRDGRRSRSAGRQRGRLPGPGCRSSAPGCRRRTSARPGAAGSTSRRQTA